MYQSRDSPQTSWIMEEKEPQAPPWRIPTTEKVTLK
jgi:hypothetical protein